MPEASVLSEIKADIISRIQKAIEIGKGKGDLPGYIEPDVKIDVPPRPEQGDFATSVAMAIAREAEMDPRAVASAIVKNLPLEDSHILRVDIAGPGFINFFLDVAWLKPAMARIWKEGPLYGRSNAGRGKKILVEFVSANPTGPLNVVNARAAAVGDCLSALLDAAGYHVAREFYVNDAGRQVELLGRSLEARVRQKLGQEALIPEGGYPGEYLLELADEFIREKGATVLGLPEDARVKEFSSFAVSKMVERQKKVLLDYGLKFDNWFFESSLREKEEDKMVLELLKQRGHTYESEGALWFRSTAFGDDKDRVLIKSDGTPTYVVTDIAYHRNKFLRGFDHLIDILGPDHHGYVARLKASMQALGFSPDALEVLIVQTVRLMRGNEVVKMSKRGGEFIAMEELLEEVGKDAARFFFLMRSPESHLDFDMDLAKLQSNENPVYYVQYAHARIASIFRQARQAGPLPAWGPNEVDFDLLVDPSETSLMRILAAFPEEVAEAAEARQPNRLIKYMMDVATAFHSFYTRCRVLGEDKELSSARLYLARLAQIVLGNALRLAGISAPESM